MNHAQSHPIASDAATRRKSVWTWLLVVVVLALMGLIYRDAIAGLLTSWLKRGEYSHGLIVPFLSGFVIWQRRFELAEIPTRYSWMGLIVLALSAIVFVLGELSALITLAQRAS